MVLAGNVKKGVECLYRGMLLKALGGCSFLTEGGGRLTLKRDDVVIVA